MKNSSKQYAIALYNTLRDISDKQLSSTLKEFAAMIARDHKLSSANKIIEEFIHYAKKQDGVQEIEITSAHELDEKTIAKIKKSIGEKVEAKVKIDESILGGIKIKIEDKILDASLKTQLLKLKESII